jgi:hypothetical protein
MAQPAKLVSPLSLIVDTILMIGFFALIYTIVAPHVPSSDKTDIAIWGGLTAACMSGVFWLALQMCRMVYRAQKAAGKS